MTEPYRLFVNPERTVLVRIWPAGPLEVATRSDEGAIWGPPVVVHEEGVSAPSSKEQE